MKSCPYCLDGSISNNECVNCGQEVQLKDGIPSTTDVRQTGEYRTKLQKLTGASRENLDSVLEEVREDYMDGRVIDRFFKTRTVCWRILVSSYLSGRGLVIGDHEEKVGILLSELLDEVYCVDTDLMSLRAQESIANATENEVKPVHSTLETLPFPSESFDTIVVSCRANQISEYVSKLKPLTTEDGAIVLLVDGWTREVGITALLGLGDSPEGWYERASSSIRGHSYGLHRAIERAGLSVRDQYALLSTTRHENQRGFDVHSIEAHDWLLRGPEKTASTAPLRLARSLSRVALQFGFLRQCYPRYLLICNNNIEKNDVDNGIKNGILLAGKNRSVYLDLCGREIQKVRKIPNSRWQQELNRKTNNINAYRNVDNIITGTVPSGEIKETEFGTEWNEEPAYGYSFDEVINSDINRINRHVRIVFDWLCDFQKETKLKTVEKSPDETQRMLKIGCINTVKSPKIYEKLCFPLVTSHGDLFGSNIFLTDEKVVKIIDWEWSTNQANPIIDAGFFLLQLAKELEDDFDKGFSKLFLSKNEHSKMVYENIDRYCSQLDLSPLVFKTYLPISYIYRAKQDLVYNKRLDIDWPGRINYIWDNWNELKFDYYDCFDK